MNLRVKEDLKDKKRQAEVQGYMMAAAAEIGVGHKPWDTKIKIEEVINGAPASSSAGSSNGPPAVPEKTKEELEKEEDEKIHQETFEKLKKEPMKVPSN